MELKEANDIIQDARQACMIVEDDWREVVTIRRTPRGVAVTLWADGSATRADVPQDQVTRIWSADDVRKILGLRADERPIVRQEVRP